MGSQSKEWGKAENPGKWYSQCVLGVRQNQYGKKNDLGSVPEVGEKTGKKTRVRS